TTTAFKRIEHSGARLSAIHLDHCANPSDKVLEWIDGARPAFSDGAIVTVNMLRGREEGLFQIARDSMLRRGVREDDAPDYARLRTLCMHLSGVGGDFGAGCFYHISRLRHGIYLSETKQTMLWTVATMRTHKSGVMDIELRRDLLKICRDRSGQFELDQMRIPLCMVMLGYINNATKESLTVAGAIDWLVANQPPLSDSIILASTSSNGELVSLE